ncbi:unnamed protein product [Closterium sp. NIES-53]
MHQNLRWHHRLGHPSLPRLGGMHSCLLISGLPRSLPLLLRSLAPPCIPCIEGRQRVAPHSSFPPTTAPLQTLHMDAEIRSVLICWIRAVRHQLSARSQHDLPVLRLHSDQGECRIGLVMEVARTSIVPAAAPHFLWPFAVRYAAEQLNLWPYVSHPETSPTLQWTGKVGDVSAFCVWGALSLVRDPLAGKLSPRTLRCVFLGFPTNAPGWQFYHPGSRRVLSSQNVTFDEYVCFYHLHPHCSSPVPLPLLALVSDPPPSVAPLLPQGPSPSGVSQPIAVDSGAASGGATRGTDSGGAGSGGAECPLGTGGTGGAGAGGPGTSQQEALSPEKLRKWAVQWGSPGGGASRLRVGVTRTAGAGGDGSAGAGGSATGGTVVASVGIIE